MNLAELHKRKTTFPEYRKQELRSITDDPLNEQLKELKARRARLIAEVDAEIAKLKFQQATRGTVLSKTQRREMRAEELTREKRELDAQFAAEVKMRHDNGTPISALAKECGAGSLSIFYQALTYSDPETIELNNKMGRFIPENEVWSYSEWTKFHRYAVNASRTVFRVHDVHDALRSIYIRRADQEIVGGERDLFPNFKADRAEEFIQSLDNPDFDPKGLRKRENPYETV